MKDKEFFWRAVEEYINYGVITPETEKKLLEGNDDPDARAKLWRHIAALTTN